MLYPQIFTLHPVPTTLDRDAVLRCIGECLDCVASCTACADDCLAEPDLLELVRCVRLDLDCSDICDVTVRVPSLARPCRIFASSVTRSRPARLPAWPALTNANAMPKSMNTVDSAGGCADDAKRPATLYSPRSANKPRGLPAPKPPFGVTQVHGPMPTEASGHGRVEAAGIGFTTRVAVVTQGRTR